MYVCMYVGRYACMGIVTTIHAIVNHCYPLRLVIKVKIIH